MEQFHGFPFSLFWVAASVPGRLSILAAGWGVCPITIMPWRSSCDTIYVDRGIGAVGSAFRSQ